MVFYENITRIVLLHLVYGGSEQIFMDENLKEKKSTSGDIIGQVEDFRQ